MRRLGIQFKVSEKEDLKVAMGFIKEASFSDGQNLEWAFKKLHKSIFTYIRKGQDIKKIKSFVATYLDEYYSKHIDVLKINLIKAKKNWLKVEQQYIFLLKNLFPKYKLPVRAIKAYITIWGMYPRDIDHLIFWIPDTYNPVSYINVTIAHELLHFAFYNQFYKQYPKYKNRKYNYFVWQISEIFNSVVQRSQEWLLVFKMPNMGYPDQEKLVNKLAKKYTYNIDANNLIKDILKQFPLINSSQ